MLTAAREGDLDAREILFSRLFPTVLAQASFLCPDQRSAEELAQTSLAHIFERLDQLRKPARALGWIWQIVRGSHQAAQRRSRFEPAGLENATCRPPVSEDPVDRLAARQMSEAIFCALVNLPPSLRAVFGLRVLMARSTAETARELKISDEAVRGRLKRARSALRPAMTAEHQRLIPA